MGQKRRFDNRPVTSGQLQTCRCTALSGAKCQKQPSDDQHLPLALDNALKRMPMFAGKGDHLRRLCLSDFVRVGPALGDSFIMNAERICEGNR
jgi:hypothetical protein